MTSIAARSGRTRSMRWWLPAAVVAAGVAAIGVAARVGGAPAPSPSRAAVELAVALRTVETSDVALADQAVAQSGDPSVRSAAATAAAHGDAVAARIWALLDAWRVPGVDRLPAPPGPSTGAATLSLHHDCTIYVNDELARLSMLSGAGFDRRFVADWIGHASTAEQALATASAVAGSAPGLREVVAAAGDGLRADDTAIRRAGRS